MEGINQVVLALCDGKSGDAALEKQIVEEFMTCFELWKRKHRSYGRNNIARTGFKGIAVRLSDKMARLENILFSGGVDAVGETTLETVRDMTNYCLMYPLAYKGTWPGTLGADVDSATAERFTTLKSRPAVMLGRDPT